MNGKVLVAYDGKHGATGEIAERIGKVLHEAGLAVEVLPAVRVGDPAAYGAVVLGSAIYMGMWRKGAARFLKANETALAGLPVWLFSSGPTGEGDLDTLMRGWTFPKGLQPVADRIQPRGATIFRGAFDVAKANWFERWIMKKVNAAAGEFRDWQAIEAWAQGIAAVLQG